MRITCYARVSTPGQAKEDKVSIPTQIEWAEALARERGWEWIEPYIEPGIFGDVESEKREAFSRLFADARENKFDLVLVYHSSRFAREADIGMRMCRLLGQARIQVYFRNSPIEPVEPSKFSWGMNIGSMYMNAFSFIGDFQENVARSERVRSGFVGLAKRGKLFNAPYGYKKVPQIKVDSEGKQVYDWTFEIDPQESLIVKEIFTTYAKAGGSLRKIMLSLNSRLIPSPSGKRGSEAWSATTVRNLLKDVAYIGKVHWGRKLGGKYLQGKSKTGKQKRVFTPPETWIIKDSVNHKGFINVILFNKVQEKLKLRYALKGRAIASQGLLTGLVKCGRCGRNAYYKTTKSRKGKRGIRHDYTCPGYFTYKSCQRHVIGAIKLHEIIISEISKIASDPRYKDALLAQQGNDQTGSLSQELVSLQGEFMDIESRQKRISIAYETKILSLKEFGEAKQRLDQGAYKILEEMNRIKGILEDTDRAEEAKRKFKELLANFKEEFVEADFDRQKELLQALIASVVVQNGVPKINYRF